jgi:hypothetical protein
LLTYSESVSGTCGTSPKIAWKPAFQFFAKNRVWCSSSGSSPLTPSMMSRAPGPAVRFSQYSSG